MGTRAVGVTDQASGAGVADIRVRERTDPSLGTTVAEQYVIPTGINVVSFRGMGSTFRMIGSAATPQWLAFFQNAAGSTVLVVVRSMVVTMDAAAATIVVNPIFGVSRPTGTAAGGTTLTKVNVGTGADAAESSNASVSGLGGASADGTNSLITGLTAGSWGWRTPGTRMHTLVGQVLPPERELIPTALRPDGVVLRAGERVGVTLVTNAAADNNAAFHYLVSVLWDEYQLP